MKRLRAAALAASIVCAGPIPVFAQPPDTSSVPGGGLQEPSTPDRFTQIEQLQHALVRLPVAAGLACVLALRPRRRGTPRREAQVVQTRIILAIVGAVVMLVVGRASPARSVSSARRGWCDTARRSTIRRTRG